MSIYDQILYKYFLSKEHVEKTIKAAEEEKRAILETAYPHTVPTETGLATAGGSIEHAVIEALELEDRVKAFIQRADKSQVMFKKALQKISKRKQILLFTYYRTGIILTNGNELERAQEYLIDVLEAFQEKEDRLIKKEYMKQYIQSTGEVREIV